MALRVGLQLYSVRNAMAEEPAATLSTVCGLGYRYIELCNQNAATDPGCGFGLSADEMKAILAEYGSRVVSNHVSPLAEADISALGAFHRALGSEFIVCPGWQFTNYDEVMQTCERFNDFGRKLKEEGLSFLYHNHFTEFATVNGTTPMDLFMENTDPEYVNFEIDSYWVMRSGLDPIDIFRKIGKRIKLLHQKDFPWNSMAPINLLGIRDKDKELSGIKRIPNSQLDEDALFRKKSAFTEVGYGIMPIQDIIEAADCTDAKYIIVEQDETQLGDEIESVRRSIEAFHRYRGIEWN